MMGGVHGVDACEDGKTSYDAASVGVGRYGGGDDDCGRDRDPWMWKKSGGGRVLNKGLWMN
jgi:hypothetical protein